MDPWRKRYSPDLFGIFGFSFLNKQTFYAQEHFLREFMAEYTSGAMGEYGSTN